MEEPEQAGGFTVLTIEITVGLLAIVPTLNAIACIESRTGTYSKQAEGTPA